REFVLNDSWQVSFFKDPKRYRLWAGPFCNAANPLAVAVLADLGFSGAIISPELGKKEVLSLPRHCPIPLGIVVSGFFPLCISRSIADTIETDRAFKSPRGETAWVTRHGESYWTFPGWWLDLTEKRAMLQAAGYARFIHLMEPVPRGVSPKRRSGLWNWDVGLK
ncbi:MAG: U32 family peptidase, partial [Deltaproteobacteria bacterium]|nr:U32 family peptidase [Deltaproteobacteria bacterium]